MTTRVDGLPFDLRTLQIFLSVCDTGSFTAAARQLNLSQPAVSQAISELEARTGTQLFERDIRPIGLTRAGGLLRQRGSSLLADARQISPLLRDMVRHRLPLIRLGLVDSMSRALLVDLSKKLAETTENVAVLSGLTASHASALLTRRLDLLIGVDDLDDIDGLERWPLLSEPYVLLVPNDVTPPKEPQDLALIAEKYDLVRFGARSQTGIEIERHLRRLKLDLPRRMEFDTPFGVTARVAARQGFAITTPLCIFEAALPMDGLTCLPLPGPSLRRTLTLIARLAELGRLPQRVANFCKNRLDLGTIPMIEAQFPWLRGMVHCT